jgi:hypothetical protein
MNQETCLMLTWSTTCEYPQILEGGLLERQLAKQPSWNTGPAECSPADETVNSDALKPTPAQMAAFREDIRKVPRRDNPYPAAEGWGDFATDLHTAAPGTVWDLVVRDMHGRDALGMRKYGRPLQPHDGRDTLQDAYEEALDLAVYLRKAMLERDGK